MHQALDLITDIIHQGTTTTIFIINADCLNKTFDDPEYRHALQNADHLLADGSGIRLGCRIIGETVVDNVNDLFPLLCERAVQHHFSLFLFGAKPGVADQVKQTMTQRYPNLNIVGSQHGYLNFGSPEEHTLIQTINKSKADILLVALGAPLQEKWLATHRSQLAPKILMGVGGLFDFYSGNIPRAPLWLRKRGLEWTYRLYQEPRRLFKRYILGNPLFIWRVLRWKWSKSHP